MAYEILSALGAGGMGEVYRAKDRGWTAPSPLKFFPSTIPAVPQIRERFEREARVISSLSHPHICALYDVGQQGGNDYLVVECLEGQTLADPLKEGPSGWIRFCISRSGSPMHSAQPIATA